MIDGPTAPEDPPIITRQDIRAVIGVTMSEELTKAPGFWWVPGMLIRWGDGERPCDYHRVGGSDGTDRQRPIDGSDWHPVEDDPGTLGCLLQLVREAHSQPRAHLSWDAGWFVRQARDCFDWDEEIGDPDGGPNQNNRYCTEFAALSAALLAAP